MKLWNGTELHFIGVSNGSDDIRESKTQDLQYWYMRHQFLLITMKGYDMEWQLIQVNKTEWIQDDSGYYTLIHYVKDNIVRLDIMDRNDMPIVSFQGQADDVRKYIMQWFSKGIGQVNDRLYQSVFSIEHASYIGAELTRAAILRDNYVQD